MNITLRRASKIRNRLDARLNEAFNDLRNTQATVNMYDPDVIEQVKTKSNKFSGLFAKYLVLSAASTKLRRLIGEANAMNGIDALVAEQTALKGRMSIINTLANQEVMPTDEQMKARLEGERQIGSESSYRGYGNNTIAFGIMTEEMIGQMETMKTEIQSKIDEIQDRLETANSTITVVLDAELASVLATEKIS